MATPNVDLPVRFDGTDLATNPMDSAQDLITKAMTLMLYPVGFRDDLPEFGWPSPLFHQQPLDLTAQTQALAEWSPEAEYSLSATQDLVDVAKARIQVELNVTNTDL